MKFFMDNQNFVISDEVMKKYPEVVELIKGAISMNFDEKQYWFSVIPIMNQEQIQKLKQILTDEKERLQKLDEKYAGDIKALNEKHVGEWHQFERKKSLEIRQGTEKEAEQVEERAEEELLKKLSEI